MTYIWKVKALPELLNELNESKQVLGANGHAALVDYVKTNPWRVNLKCLREYIGSVKNEGSYNAEEHSFIAWLRGY